MAWVDIVIPAFGREKLLEEAVRSVQQQTFEDWRLLIVDDASATPLRCDSFAHDKRIEIIRLEKNSGPALARNQGASRGDSPFIAFLDSDDLWQPQKLELQLELFKDDPLLQWAHTNEVWFRNGALVRQKHIHAKQGGQFFSRALERCLISPSAVMLRRIFFEQSGGFNPAFRLCEDYEFWLRLLLVNPVGFVKDAATVKRAGEWEQLSSSREIDRYRVLALHRLWRNAPRTLSSEETILLLEEAARKTERLVKGAQKHRNRKRLATYQAWLTLFKTLRTRPMRRSS